MVAIQVWWCFWCSPYMVKINIKSHLTEAVPENSIGFIFVLFISVLIKVTSSLYDHCHAAFFLGLLVTVSMKALMSPVVVPEGIVSAC